MSKKYKYQGTGLSRAEKNTAEKLFNEYRERYSLEKLSDLSILQELVFWETINERYKAKVEILGKGKTKGHEEVIPDYILKTLDSNLTRILAIKEKLGLFEEKKDSESGFKYIEVLKKKFKKWCDENQGSRTLICPFCSKMIMLKIRTKAWEAQKHPIFRDKILCNEHLVKLFKEGKITEEDCAKILGTSKDYMKWLVSKWYSNNK